MESSKPKTPSSKQSTPYQNNSDLQETSEKASGHINFYRAISWLMWWNSDEWWPCWIGLIFFGCVVSAVKHGIPEPKFLPWSTNPFSTFATVGNYGLLVLFFAMGLIIWLAMASVNTKSWRLYPIGYLVVFFISLVSKMLASNVTLHKASIGDSIWAIILGCILRNLLSINKNSIALPPWLKVAQQTEFYIATSLVLLCIDISVLRPLAPRALFVSWIDTPLLFMGLAFVGWRFLRIDLQTAIIMSGATFICGSSAAIALGASMGAPQKSELPIAIISIFTIPSIIALPYVAKDLGFSATVSGAWFGGCVDSTGAVLASASIYGDKEAVDTSAVVKMIQNVLIGPLSVLMAWGWSHHELRMAYRANEEEMMHAITDSGSSSSAEESVDGAGAERPVAPKPVISSQDKAWVLLWKRFPKFVLGFIMTAVLFNTTVDGDPQLRSNVNTFCFYVSEWFSTLSFVSIGLGLHLDDVRQNIRNLGKLCTLYIMAQMVDIVVTGVLAWTAFTYL